MQKKDPIIQLTTQLIKAIGENHRREGLQKTPERVSRAWRNVCAGYEKKPTALLTTFQGESYDEMIVLRNSEFYSTCEHHLLPFFGRAYIGYIPKKKIIGLSKLPRFVDMYARRLQNQERLTKQIASTLYELLDAKGVGVVLEAQHLCMMARGVHKQNPTVITSSMLGRFRTDHKTRNEFLRLIGK